MLLKTCTERETRNTATITIIHVRTKIDTQLTFYLSLDIKKPAHILKRGRLKTNKQETATVPAHAKSMTYITEIDICILPVRGTAKLVLGKEGERLFEYRQSLPMSHPLGLVHSGSSKAASA